MTKDTGTIFALTALCLSIFILGITVTRALDRNESLECSVEVDGKVYECSTVPKISSDKVIKFRSGERRVEIPIDKEVIITLSK